MNTWHTQIGNTLLDRVLAYHDHKNIMIKQCCVPVNMIGNHWLVTDVLMQDDVYFNGKVLITNHAADDKIHIAKQYRVSNVKYSQMWWAKWFGVYHKERVTKNILQEHHYWNDMHINGFWMAACPRSLMDMKCQV